MKKFKQKGQFDGVGREEYTGLSQNKQALRMQLDFAENWIELDL